MILGITLLIPFIINEAYKYGKGYVTLGELRMFYHFMVHIYRSGDCEFRGCCNLSE